uniref:Mannosyltransferase n=1 Tax=Chaetoceros debilis TaxID=122233 RepID=A0A7S3V6T0_9STRA
MLKWTWFGIFVLAATSLASLVLCPHSKVEESFNLQAVHDLYYHGISPAIQLILRKDGIDSDTALYDHLRYPGVVPRSFACPLLISFILRIISLLLRPLMILDRHPLLVQSLARLILLSFNLHAHYRLAKAANARFNPSTKNFVMGNYFLLVTACQFHLPYYASRMLPNTFALGLVTHSYASWLMAQPTNAIITMVFCAAVVRCDTLILLFTFGLTLLISKQVTIQRAIRIGLVSAAVSILLTVPLDSLLWQRLLWPEAEVLLFNTVENKSSDYGVSPWHWYALKALPKGLLLTLPLVPLSSLRLPQYIANGGRKKTYLWDLEGMPFLLPVIAFVGLYSILPHKEIRFILIAFPMFNVMSAKALANIHHVREIYRKESSTRVSFWLLELIHVATVLSLLFSLLGSLLFVHVSRANYPGGDALMMLSRELELSPNDLSDQVDIFVDVASAMTGVSLFGQRYLQNISSRRVNIIKGGYENEHEHRIDLKEGKFDYLLLETPASRLDTNGGINGYDLINIASGHPRINLASLSIETSDCIYILKKRGKV